MITSKIESSKLEIMSCLSENLDKINNTLHRLSMRIQAIEDNMLKVSETVAEHEMKIANLEAAIDNLEETGTNVSDVINEIERRNFRRLNLVISGIPEQNHGSVDERKTFDENEISKVLQELSIQSSKVKQIQRVGKPKPDRPRLIKLCCTTIEDRKEILMKGKSLRNSASYKDI